VTQPLQSPQSSVTGVPSMLKKHQCMAASVAVE
jgi:hypothetical protein